MKTSTERESIQVLTNLLSQAREEADELRRKVKKYENILLSSKLLMGHELKKPTTAIIGYLELVEAVLEGLDGKARDEAVELLEKARKECDLLNELNVVFIELLKINGGERSLPIQKINVKKLFADVINAFPEKYKASSRIELRISPKVESINFNASALKLIVSNLMENALIYSKDGTKVEVEVEHTIDKRQMSNRELMKVKVKDNGEGIPREYLQKIFSPFVRLNEGKAEGSGLGLTLVRSLVELHGGEVSISSQKGHGTTVYLIIPMLEEPKEFMVL